MSPSQVELKFKFSFAGPYETYDDPEFEFDGQDEPLDIPVQVKLSHARFESSVSFAVCFHELSCTVEQDSMRERISGFLSVAGVTAGDRRSMVERLLEFLEVEVLYAHSWRVPPKVVMSVSGVEGGGGVADVYRCGVCMEREEKGVVGVVGLAGLLCSHLFHEACIARWLRTSDSCPVCGSDIDASP
uniref:RING-type E3 ubiquitin transferase n=1 Tax=Kalanchoe fedtschenkoi TaxID=63787 RepID=A0A7N0ZYQ1_KALFE